MVKYRFFKKALIIIALLVFTTMTAGYFIRNKVLNHLLEGRLNAVESGTGISISYAEAKFSGFNSIEIHQLNINPPKGDTLLKVDHIKVRFNPIALFAMRLKFGYTEVIRPELTLWRQGTESNYLFLLEQKGRDSIQNSSDTDQGLKG
jgi:hypothetical protein